MKGDKSPIIKALSDILAVSPEDLLQQYVEPMDLVFAGYAGKRVVPGDEGHSPTTLRVNFQLRYMVGVLKTYWLSNRYRDRSFSDEYHVRVSRILWMRTLVYGITHVPLCAMLPSSLVMYLSSDAELKGLTPQEHVFLEQQYLIDCGFPPSSIEPDDFRQLVSAWSLVPDDHYGLFGLISDVYGQLVTQYRKKDPAQYRELQIPYQSPSPGPAVQPTPVTDARPIAPAVAAGTGEQSPPSDIAAAVLAYIREQLAGGHWPINQTGAMAHVTQQGLGLVVPKIYEEISIGTKQKVDAVEQALSGLALPSEVQYGFRSKKRKNKTVPVNLLHLDPGWFADTGQVLDVNPDIVVRN